MNYLKEEGNKIMKEKIGNFKGKKKERKKNENKRGGSKMGNKMVH